MARRKPMLSRSCSLVLVRATRWVALSRAEDPRIGGRAGADGRSFGSSWAGVAGYALTGGALAVRSAMRCILPTRS
jgi:hypothetical protein